MAYDGLMRVATEQMGTRTSDLSDVHDQVLPADAEGRSMVVPVQSNRGYAPSLPAPPPQDSEECQEQAELTALEQKVVFTSGFDPSTVMEDADVNNCGLVFQKK